ncbi:MAG: adenosylmethionine decarboxylase [Defluviitaleaceae bacterium]|nr:adenosylmethionine decarboxylase [Defluviitaleaceae bacterium]
MYNLKTLGRHILVEYYNCASEVLKDPALIEREMNQAALEAKATIVESKFHHFNPWGVSGAVIVSESHLTIHTWPEYGFAAADFFTCGDIDPWKSFEYLEKVLKAEFSESVEIPRGLTAKIKKHANVDFGDMRHKIQGE